MTAGKQNQQKLSQAQFYTWLCLGLFTAITVARLGLLTISPFNLGPDEAQYWDWSHTSDFGYFSKPPMIAWIIGLERAVCGDGEACLRISSPLFHLGTALVLFALGRAQGDARIGFYGGLIFILLPAVSFSSGIVSTDVPLLFFWSLALFSFHRLLERRTLIWGAGLGCALGLTFLSKYAAVYFILCAGIFLLVSKEKSWRTLIAPFGLAGLLSLLILSPNLIWNAQHGFATVSHTAANANWQVALFNLESLGDFIGDQFGMFGPLLFPLLMIFTFLAIKSRGSTLNRAQLFLLCFFLPILVIVTTQSFISRANANWAATSLVAASLVIPTWLLGGHRIKWGRALFTLALSINLALGAFMYGLALWPSLIEPTGMSGAFKRVRGWDVIGASVHDMVQTRSSKMVLADDRLILTELLYYARDINHPMRIWDHDEIPQNHYEQTIALTTPIAGPVLLVARSHNPKSIIEAFDQARFIKTLTVPVGGAFTRTLYIFELEGFHGR